MTGSVVPHGTQGLRQCVFFFGSRDSVWQVWLRFNAGTVGPPLGMGKDEGLEILSEEQYHLRPAKTSGILWLPDFQFALHFSQRG